jgi:hypothetical protein
MPFGGFPVFRSLRATTLVLNRRSSPRLPRLLRALTRSLPAAPRLTATRLAPERVTRELGNPPEHRFALQRLQPEGSSVAGLPSPTGAHS